MSTPLAPHEVEAASPPWPQHRPPADDVESRCHRRRPGRRRESDTRMGRLLGFRETGTGRRTPVPCPCAACTPARFAPRYPRPGPLGERGRLGHPGERQYALFAGWNVEGSACGHVSENGASSFLNRYALHKCNSAGISPVVSADASAEELDGWLNGVAGDRWLENPKQDDLISSAYHASMQGHFVRLPGVQQGEDETFPKDHYYNPSEGEPLTVEGAAVGNRTSAAAGVHGSRQQHAWIRVERL